LDLRHYRLLHVPGRQFESDRLAEDLVPLYGIVKASLLLCGAAANIISHTEGTALGPQQDDRCSGIFVRLLEGTDERRLKLPIDRVQLLRPVHRDDGNRFIDIKVG